MKWIMASIFVLGGLISSLNFYLSFLRYPLHRMRGGKSEGYRWVSGIPLLGSFFVAVSLLRFWQSPWLFAMAVVLILIDTGGFHWFLCVLFWQEVLDKKNRPEADSAGPPEGKPSGDP